MAILVTGGAGFIGVELVKELLKRGEEIIIFDRVIGDPLFSEEKRVRRIRGDITNWAEVFNAASSDRIDAVYHLAGILSGVSEGNPWASININALGTYHVLEAARLFQIKKIIYSSSMGCYTVTRDTVVTEETRQRPTLIYGVTKVFGELLGLYYHRRFGLDFRGVRFPQLIGPNVKTFGFGQYNPWLIEAAIKGEPFDVWAPEDTVLPLLYIKDAVRSLVMLHDAHESKVVTRVYNLGQIMPPPTARDLVDEVRKYYPEARIDFRPDPKAAIGLETIPEIIRCDEAEKEWGWHVSYSLEDAVRDFIEGFKKDVP